ncbi:uncharacterized protein LOC6589352 [Drosophila persimilis]|uniref:uncharacterized protein LOC6589352 n=1 Tax=Drosophila persimilis TaxID=7234 RepID=UPI000F090D82|nr:uncharacterized protein LOC6589352 [Drosophila persimilis]
MDERERCQSTSNRQWPEGLDMQEAMADAASPSPQNWKRSDSLKIFSRAMMRDWRKRGEEMHHLQKETEYLRGEYKQTNNTVHMCKALKQVELERNSDLQLELMKSNLNFEEFHSSISSLTEVKEKLLNEVEMRKREHDELQAVADQRKTELNAALGELRNDENRLLDEEDVMNHLRTNNANLVNEIALLRWLQMKYKMSEKCLTKKLEEANERMTIMQDELNFLHDRVRAWNTNEPMNEPQIRPVIEQLQELSNSIDSFPAECRYSKSSNNEPQENEPQPRPLIEQLQELSASIDSFPTECRNSSNRSSAFPMVWPTQSHSQLMRQHSHALQNGFKIPTLFKIVSLVLGRFRSRSK